MLLTTGLPQEMNTDWFRDQMAARKLSQRGLAKLMKLDPAAISLMLRNQRKMSTEEAHQLASILGVKTTEVLRQAGIAVTDDVRKVPISAAVDEHGVVNLFPDKTHDKVDGPADCPAGTYGVQCRAASALQDGWLLFVSPNQMEPHTQLDRLCLVTTLKGHATIAMLRRGYRTGTYNLIAWPGREVRADTSVAWCSPVLWVKP